MIISATTAHSAAPSRPADFRHRRSFSAQALSAFALLAACTAMPAWSLSASSPASAPVEEGASTPSRALRLSSVEGQVRVIQDGQTVADPAPANLPLFAGSQISTGNDGRAEIQLEDGSVARLSPNTTVTFSVIDKQGTNTHTEIVLSNGLAYFELQPSNAEHTLHVNYGSASFAATSFSVVRITLDAPPGDLAVFSGNLHLVRGDALQLDIHGGESLAMNATDAKSYNLTESIQPDSWDTWNADRDQALNAQAGERTAASNSFVNSTGVGMNDLDANGNWYNVPGQGYIWSPYDAQMQGASWDPYGLGHWVYNPRFGYMWVSGYGWGYGPYQCGLWNYYDTIGWGWLPGGGCDPWWFGNSGWGYNIGVAPRGYLPPRRPVLPPRNPRNPVPHQLLTAKVVNVDRRVNTPGHLPISTHSGEPVTIAGHTVEPLKPISPRQAYNRAATAPAGHPATGYFPTPSRPAAPVAVAHQPLTGGHSTPQPLGHSASSSGGSHATTSSSGGGSHSFGGGSSVGGGSAGGGGHASGGGGGGGSHK